MGKKKGWKFWAALAGGIPSKEFFGAQGSVKDIGRSRDSEKNAKAGRAKDETAAVQAENEAAAAQQAAEEAAILEKAQESQRRGLKRKGRRASILTSSQGLPDPLGLP